MTTAAEQFPPGMRNAFLFSAFNALSFQIVLSSPMVLYAKSLNASATVLGIIAGMMPLLVIFQIPAASHINRIGYRRFVLSGWGTRVLFIFGMALVPLTASFLNPTTRLALLLMLLFGFNLSRGISSCAWLPWITTLVPETLRGKYLALDAANMNLFSAVTFLVAGVSLFGAARSWQYSVLFAFSAVAGAISLNFLKRIPDVPPPQLASVSKGPVPWLAMLRHPPFRKLIHAVIVWSVAYGGITTFTVAFLKVGAGMTDTKILFLNSAMYIGGLCSLWLLGSRLDRLGSKPVLGFACGAWLAVMAGWIALAGGACPMRLTVVLALLFLMGLLAALANMACTRLAMAVIPPTGRNHFFALYSVLSNVILGLAPIGWGLLIDAVGQRHPIWLGLEWTRYTVFFAATALVFALTLVFARRLDEPAAVSMEALLREILIQSPLRFWLRLWPRS